MNGIIRITVAALSLAALAQSAAAAAPGAGPQTSSSGPVIVDGVVPSSCRLSPATAGSGASNVTFTDHGGAASDVTVNLLVDPNTARTQSAVGVVQFQVLCTGAHTLTVSSTSGGLVNTSTSASGGGFENRANYSLQASWDGKTRTLTTNGAKASLDLSGLDSATGPLIVTVTVPPGEGPLVAGAYQDTINIDLSAN